MDIHARDAQETKSHQQLIHTTATSQCVTDSTPLEQLLTLTAVVNAKTANGQTSFQTMREQDVSQDQRLNATACRDNHKMVILASNAQWE
jgi:hypothetical protein